VFHRKSRANPGVDLADASGRGGGRHPRRLGSGQPRRAIARTGQDAGVDERRDAAEPLRLTHGVQRERGLAARFGDRHLCRIGALDGGCRS